MKKLGIQVGELRVIEYTRVDCPHNPAHTWELSEIRVTECAYFYCVKNNDQRFFDDYIALWAKRTPGVRDRSYHEFQKLVDQVRNAGGYSEVLAENQPMRVHIGTRCLYDGHHRAAIICALFGPNKIVPIEEGADPYPTDLDLCARGLPPQP